MAFQVSPGITITETDLTLGVTAVSTSKGGYVGAFNWGPIEERVLVTNESDLASRFGTPTTFTSQYFLTAASFLAYSNALEVVRVLGKETDLVVEVANALNVSGGGTSYAFSAGTFPLNYADTAPVISVGGVVDGDAVLTVNTVTGAATLTGVAGLDASPAPEIRVQFRKYAASNASSPATGVLIKNSDDYDSKIASDTHKIIAKYAGTYGNDIKVYVLDTSAYAALQNSPMSSEEESVYKAFDSAPESSELHIAVLKAGAIVERFSYTSTVEGTRAADGTNIYFKDVINNQSKYVWVGGDLDAADASATPFSLSGGDEDNGVTNTDTVTSPAVGNSYTLDLTDGLVLFSDAETTDISLLFVGPASGTEVNYAIDNIAEVRKDVVVFFSPEQADVVAVSGQELTNVLDFRTTGLGNKSSSYAFMDCNWKYMYDRYNDKYRWIPCCGDTAGLAARTSDPWSSPAGYNRGQLKNVVKLAWNPNKAQRDELYKLQVNPIISQVGQGTVLLGDKTLLSRPSAFDRINVRRLFIVLEKSIANAAKFLMFEFNDQFTRAAFRNLVEPFLRDVQGRRGITDFRVVCDTTNNTGEVIDRNEFVGSIYVKPARSINFITLNFVAVRTSVSFEEIIGA